jgi:hypothetical protein
VLFGLVETGKYCLDCIAAAASALSAPMARFERPSACRGRKLVIESAYVFRATFGNAPFGLAVRQLFGLAIRNCRVEFSCGQETEQVP